MNHRPFARAGFDASEVGLGCWQLGADWAELSEPDCEAVIAAALDSGVNFFDTADVYGAGRSEAILGRVLAGRDDVFVATKFGRLEGYPDDYSYELLKRCAENSRERLQVEALDLVQLHCVPTAWLAENRIWDWLRQLRQDGVIREFGASVESMDEAQLCLRQEGLCSLQVIFNLFRQKPRDVLFEAAKQRDVGIIVRLPLASGLLGGKMTTESVFHEGDHRHYNKDGAAFNVGETFAGLPFEKGLELIDNLRVRLDGWDHGTFAQWAMRWILDHEAVSVVIPGATRPDQIKDNAASSDLPPLDSSTHEELKVWYEACAAAHVRGPY